LELLLLSPERGVGEQEERVLAGGHAAGHASPAGISPILPITSLLGMPPVATARTKMGQMSKRPSNHCELQVLGSFRNFAHRQEAVGSFRKSLASALHLQSSVYEISEIGLGKSRKF
jgi:hypothetical protein